MTRLAWTMNRYVAFLTWGSCPLSAPGQRCWRGFPLGSSRRWGCQGFWGAQLEELAQYECWKGHDAVLSHYGYCHTFRSPEVSCDLGYLHCTSQRHHVDEADHDKDYIQGCVCSLLSKCKGWCHTGQRGAALPATWALDFWASKSSLGLVHLAEGLGGPYFCKWLGRWGKDWFKSPIT